MSDAPKAMTWEERIERAAEAAHEQLSRVSDTVRIDEQMARNAALDVLSVAFPELFGPNPTHWIAPMEPTDAMLTAGAEALDLCYSLEPGEGFDEQPEGPVFEAMRDAYLGKSA